MFSKALMLALAASPLVAAHGKVAVVTGDQGGNGTALGILGGVVPGPGRNSVTEKDTTVFSKKQAGTNIMSDGLGKTKGSGENTPEMLSLAMAQSGDTLPQVSANGGTLSGTYHIVTTDGAGPIKAVLDPTGTGKFSEGMMLEVTTQVPGTNGNIKPPKKGKRSFLGEIWERSLDALEARGLVKRASNVNTDHPMSFAIPAGVKCTGEMAGQKNVCLVKIANENKAGPFGGCIAMQIAGTGGAAAGNATAPATTPAAAPAAADVKAADADDEAGDDKKKDKKNKKNAKNAKRFTA
ncbi:hypothetical protein MCOR02_005606 [Pyricularia oryzae]|uniref:MAS3 protein n=1 Tax=Pyricularia oryzae TaxID=318829 RepID=A0A4P7NLF9_PYROR|nr:hypothetical protein MCOR02_005606 [Pyricularia oryzae]KAI6289744.1 hypothetical protein MCOR34_010647 [Pyricularia oryzae]KAI6454252.1 hypothetical protein MCOR17_009042 [Pyricularia oryzae]KAI6503161.1 hypothetical protein MCOR13_005179 [Pyricularia oryzae]KAI6644946.1 hypothetical protein MCOR14_000657 [Pyricularia oryzae]